LNFLFITPTKDGKIIVSIELTDEKYI